MLKTIDLFAGAGGLSYGFESTGEFLIVAAAENNKNARKTYIENHKGRNDIRMITDVRGYDFSALASEFDGIDVVIGGPPCQGFSNANRQKNHIISMNNSLVKEYFRAIREIRPKAFVMENVSMLSSETHRFYDSTKDHNVVTELGVQMREDELVLSDSDYHGYSLMNIIEADEIADYKISDELFQLLNVLYKNRNNEERLRKYIDNKSKLIIDKIASQTEEVKNNLGFLGQISNLINTEQMGNYELYLLTGDDIAEKKVLEMRQAGMRIREDCAFRIPMNFTNEDFAEEYQGMKFDLNAGDIIGIGQKRTFDALYQNDIIKNGSSIVDVGGNDKLKEIQCDFSQSTIKITLPSDQYEDYRSCGYNRSKYKMLNAILIVPALVEAIGIIAADEKDSEHQSGHQNRAWYKTIVVNLKRFAENDERKYLQLLEKPFASAELLLGNNSAEALDFLCQVE